uniref:Uncharacterized protein n=1 Tax=Musa acuminata subsp. malaccensis TaxID=214687 RepID=A0A804JWF3_MUSAM
MLLFELTVWLYCGTTAVFYIASCFMRFCINPSKDSG